MNNPVKDFLDNTTRWKDNPSFLELKQWMEHIDSLIQGKEQAEQKCMELARLLLESRDALHAISLVSAKLHGIDLTLADRIETALEPWRVSE